MNRKIYWEIATLIIVFISVSAVLLLRNTDTEPKIVYKDLSEEQIDKIRSQSKPIEVDKPSTKASAETTNAEKPITEKPIVTNKTSPTQAGTEAAAQTAETADVPVSPFGFGPYPEVPSGYPYDNPWNTDGLTDSEAEKSELLERVRIKLWNEGNPPEGISWENGKIYPIYPNTIYVVWDYSENDDGVIEKYPGEVISGTLSDEANMLLDEGVIPPDVIVYEFSEAGIDPYTYLDLNK